MPERRRPVNGRDRATVATAAQRSRFQLPSPKVIGIVGSRRRNLVEDFNLLQAAFDSIYEEGDTLVSGGCPACADEWAEAIAKARGLIITIHYPKWNGPDGKFAGLTRNTKIAEDCDVLIAVVAEDRKGGAEDTVRKAQNLSKEIILI